MSNHSVSNHSVSNWVARVKDGDSEAARHLWERYFPEICRLARNKLRMTIVAAEDEEDVALSALKSFCRAAELGRYEELHDRQGLWKLLCRITHFKAVDLIRRNNVRQAGKVASLDARVHNEEQQVSGALDVVDEELTAEMSLMMAEEIRRLLEMLPDEQIREIAIARMTGDDNQSIAVNQGCKLRTVERRLQRIRAIWKDELASQRRTR